MSRAAEAASYSGKKMMESAGLSWQSLAAWKAGTRRPRPESIHAVGHALLLRGDRIRRIGLELIQAAQQASAQRKPAPVQHDGLQRVLFVPSPDAALSAEQLHDDGTEGASYGWDGSERVSTPTRSSKGG